MITNIRFYFKRIDNNDVIDENMKVSIRLNTFIYVHISSTNISNT